MEAIVDFLTYLAQFRELFLLLFELVLIIVFGVLAIALYRRLKRDYEENKQLANQP